MNDCIFCKIIKGELPSKTVYEDDLIKVIMNINPTTNGHLLVLPKEHYVDIFDIDEKIINHSFKVIRDTLYPLLRDNLGCEGVTLSENNLLGQEVHHFHIHVTPRYQNDLVDYIYNKDNLEDLDTVFEKLQ
ncbi:MAG: HIT domain-containing protein [Bacilli bacterium]|nr:HIT domain-containing protein [Bacilli bacterium]